MSRVLKVDLINEIHELNKINAQLIRGIEAVRALINESYGVVGLHMNGDIATWDELQETGHYEEWLYEFNLAEELINKND